MKYIDKIIDILANPLSYKLMGAVSITSAILLSANFLPEVYQKRLFIDVFLKSYGSWLPLVFILSLFILLIQLFGVLSKKKEDKEFEQFYKQEQEKLFNDSDALMYLKKTYSNHPDAVLLPYYNQKVKLLEQYGLITKATKEYLQPHTSNPMFPYILQPIAEEKLKKKERNGTL